MHKKEHVTYFPNQKRPSSAKGTKFCKQCIDAGILEARGHDGQGIRKSQYDKSINYDLLNNILHENDLETVVSEHGAKGHYKGHRMQNMPLMNPKINVLVGEELLRGFDYYAMLSNPEANQRKQEQSEAMAKQMIARGIQEGISKEEAEQRIKEFKKRQKYTFQDKREKMANSLAKYFYQKLDMKLTFNKGWRDALIAGEELYCVDVVGEDVSFRRVDPLTLFVARMGERPYIDDADIIVEDTYESLGWVLDHYWDVLKDRQIKSLEEGHRQHVKRRDDLVSEKVWEGTTQKVGSTLDFDYSMLSGGSGPSSEAYDEDGNIRVSRVVWRSMRKMGVLTYYDEEGSKQKTLVHETHEADEDEGEKIDWYWVNEWWEGTRLAEDHYVKMQARPVQFKDRSNLSAGGSGYVGTVYNINASKSMSIVDMLKPYQYTYNELHARVRMAFKKWQGPLVEFDLAKKPKWMEMTEIMAFAQESGLLLIDSNTKGPHGQPAQNTTGRQLNPTMGSYIKDHWQMMQEIKEEMGEIVGVTAPRQGDIHPRTAVRNVESMQQQTKTITEPLMNLHDKTKERALQAVIETAKYVLREHKFRAEYILDDGSREVLDFDGKELSDEDIGIFVSSSMEVRQAIQSLKTGAAELMKSGAMRITDYMSLSSTKSSAEIVRQMEDAEAEAMERQERARTEEMESRERVAQMEQETEMAKKQADQQINDSKLQAKIEEAMMKMGFDERKHADKMPLDRDRVDTDRMRADETERHNRAIEEIKEQEIRNKKEQKSP